MSTGTFNDEAVLTNAIHAVQAALGKVQYVAQQASAAVCCDLVGVEPALREQLDQLYAAKRNVIDRREEAKE